MKPKLTLRDLFWLVLVCAMGLGWWLDRSRQAELAVHWHDAYEKIFWQYETSLRPIVTEDGIFERQPVPTDRMSRRRN